MKVFRLVKPIELTPRVMKHLSIEQYRRSSNLPYFGMNANHRLPGMVWERRFRRAGPAVKYALRMRRAQGQNNIFARALRVPHYRSKADCVLTFLCTACTQFVLMNHLVGSVGGSITETAEIDLRILC